MITWSVFNEFSDISDKYLPESGEGNSMATQIVTAINKIVYKYYNDGDVLDDPYGYGNNISTFGNWLYNYLNLEELEDTIGLEDDRDEYTSILYKVAKKCLNEEFLAEYVDKPTISSVYSETDGPFHHGYIEEEEEDDYWDDEVDECGYDPYTGTYDFDC